MTIDESKEMAKKTVEKMFQCINGASTEFTDALFDELLREHRTLQQSMIRAFAQVLIRYADYHEENPTYHDLRNKQSIEFAKKVKALDEYLPFI